MGIDTKAMIVRLKISAWTARKEDKAAASTVADYYHADREVGNYRKSLIPKEAIARVTKIANKARVFHDEQTLPWDDAGGRILPATNFLPYSEEIRKLKSQFEVAVEDFVANIVSYKEAAKKELGDLYRESDYPSIESMRDRYSFSAKIEPIPEGQDFRVALDATEVAKIRESIEADVEDRVSTAMEDLYVRLYNVVKHFSDKLNTKDAIFRNSLVSNIVEIVDLLPRLNLNGNGTLESLRREVESKLAHYDPDTLRQDTNVRAKAAAEADAILQQMSGYVGQ